MDTFTEITLAKEFVVSFILRVFHYEEFASRLFSDNLLWIFTLVTDTLQIGKIPFTNNLWQLYVSLVPHWALKTFFSFVSSVCNALVKRLPVTSQRALLDNTQACLPLHLIPFLILILLESKQSINGSTKLKHSIFAGGCKQRANYTFIYKVAIYSYFWSFHLQNCSACVQDEKQRGKASKP